MKKSLLAASVAIALSGISSSFAADGNLIINNAGQTITVPLSSFQYDSTTNELTLTTTATLTKGSGGDTGGGDTGGGDTGGGDTGGGDDGGGDTGGGDDSGGGDASCNVAGVACRYAMHDWPKDTLGLRITIPQGGILSSQFVAGQKNQSGNIDFEAKAQFPYPSTNIWISTKPGGPDIGQGSRLNYCSKQGVSFIYGIAWTQGSDRGMCQLTPGETYYLNIEHSSKSTPASTVYRYVK